MFMIPVFMMYMMDVSTRYMLRIAGLIPMSAGDVKVWDTSLRTVPQTYQVQMATKVKSLL